MIFISLLESSINLIAKKKTLTLLLLLSVPARVSISCAMYGVVDSGGEKLGKIGFEGLQFYLPNLTHLATAFVQHLIHFRSSRLW